jgi:4-hydroxy-tetrahydrodipicolinate reductase
MKIAVVGYGQMGHAVEGILRDRGHDPACIDLGEPYPAGCAVGIDFTQPEAVPANVARAIEAGSRYVVGTTGWEEHIDEVRGIVARATGGLVHSPNFSLGVNVYFRIVREAAALLARFPDYDPFVLERHHRLKKDAPSGTAKVLTSIIEDSKGPRPRAVTSFVGPIPPGAFHVVSVRAGGIVGDHTVGFDSGGDEILIEHRARSRRGFALGAVLAAEWVAGRRGFYAFDAVLDDILASPPSRS